MDLLKDEIARLDTYEKTIDQHKQWCMQVQLIKRTSGSPSQL